jgi:hypothetical protein
LSVEQTIFRFAGNGWGAGKSFKSDAWWLEHYMIGSHRPEELLAKSGKVRTCPSSRILVGLLLSLTTCKQQYKSFCNPKLWKWRLLYSDGKDEVTGVLQVNIGAWPTTGSRFLAQLGSTQEREQDSPLTVWPQDIWSSWSKNASGRKN